MTKDILSTLAPMISIAQKEGADDVELFGQLYQDREVNIESNSLKTSISGIQEGVGIRVIINKSVGFTAVNSLARDRILDGIRDAISIAKVTPPQDYHEFPESEETRPVKNLYDEKIVSSDIGTITEYAAELLETMQGIDKRLTFNSGSFLSRIERRAIVSSKGIEANERKTGINWRVFGWAIDGDDIGSFEYESDAVTSLKDLDISKGIENFAAKALANLGAVKTEAFKGPAIFTPEAVSDLLTIVCYAATGTSIQAGNSYLQDKIGESVAIEDFSLIDNGTLPGGIFSRSFDREGVPSQLLRIVDSGVFKGVLHSAFTSKKVGLSSTGNASGGFRVSPSISGTNLEVQPGNMTLDEMIHEVRHGVYIQRISAAPDYTTGNFSGVVKGGRLIKDGEIRSTLKEITAVGNIFDSLKAISGMTKERKHLRDMSARLGVWLVPFIKVENIDFAT
ncbi:MAG: TldD/PmbA family protein [Candidatus Thorarchaeota archaeon]